MNLTKEEQKFLKGLQKFNKGTTQQEIVDYINKHKSAIGITRIRNLLKVANLQKSAMDSEKSNIESQFISNFSTEEMAGVLGSEFAADKTIAESYESSVYVSKVEPKNEAFENDIANFLSGFKKQYLSRYLDDIKSMNKTEATTYLQNKINPLIESIVQSFKDGYSYVGKTPQIQDKMAYERIARVEIIEDQFAVMFGDVIESKIKEIASAGKTLDDDSLKTIKDASDSFGIGASAKRRIEKRQKAYDDARGVSKTKTDEFIDENAATVSTTTASYDASKARNDVIHAYADAANEFADIMGKLDSIHIIKEAGIDHSALSESNSSIFAEFEMYKRKKTLRDKYKGFGKFFAENLEGKSDEEIKKLTAEIKKLSEAIAKANEEALASQPEA